MSDKVITRHRQDALSLGRNTIPINECAVHTKTLNGKDCKALTVPLLDCASVWLRVQKEAEAWIAPGGKLIEDNIARNRQINKAYAQLWLADRRFQWAGLAAFASKQVGCGLLHAAHNVSRSLEEIKERAARPDITGSADIAANSAIPSAVAGGSGYMYGRLALGNTVLFLDIYPLHRFYMLRGYTQMTKCLAQREAIAEQVIWPIDQKKLYFGSIYPEITRGFELIESGRISQSVKVLAVHEQINILQKAIYNDAAMQTTLDGNQLSWALNFPSGVAAEIQLTLSAQCSVGSSNRSVWFPKNKSAQLYDSKQRMEFVNRAADRFDVLLTGDQRVYVEASLREIAFHGSAR